MVADTPQVPNMQVSSQTFCRDIMWIWLDNVGRITKKMFYGGVHCWLRSGLEDNPGRESWTKQKLNMWWCFVFLVLDHYLQGAKQVKHVRLEETTPTMKQVTTMKPLGGSLPAKKEAVASHCFRDPTCLLLWCYVSLSPLNVCCFCLHFSCLQLSYISQICWFVRVKAHVCRLCRSKSCFSWAWVIC